MRTSGNGFDVLRKHHKFKYSERFALVIVFHYSPLLKSISLLRYFFVPFWIGSTEKQTRDFVGTGNRECTFQLPPGLSKQNSHLGARSTMGQGNPRPSLPPCHSHGLCDRSCRTCSMFSRTLCSRGPCVQSCCSCSTKPGACRRRSRPHRRGSWGSLLKCAPACCSCSTEGRSGSGHSHGRCGQRRCSGSNGSAKTTKQI